MTDTLRNQILVLYAREWSAGTIAKHLGVTRDVVCGHLRRAKSLANLEKARAVQRTPPEICARVTELYHHGYLAREIAADIGKTKCAVECIIRTLRREGRADEKIAAVARNERLVGDKRRASLVTIEQTAKPRMSDKQIAALLANRTFADDIEEGPVTLRHLIPEQNRTLTGRQMG